MRNRAQRGYFANLAGGKHFSKLDLRQDYHQMEVTEESKKYLTINMHKDLYQHNRLVFGVTSCPANWQRAIDQVLEGVIDTQCILDDMIITGKTDEEHLENSEKLLKQLHKTQVLKQTKRSASFSEIEFSSVDTRLTAKVSARQKRRLRQ